MVRRIDRNTESSELSLVLLDCYPGCGISGSVETRRRRCLGKDCPGNEVEKRACLSCSSTPSSNWSCWTDWSECSPCRPTSTKSRSRTCLSHSCSGESREDRLCSSCSSPWLDVLTESRFSVLHLLSASVVSLLTGVSLMICVMLRRQRRRSYRQASNTFLHHHDDRDYFQASTSNSSSSPHTAPDCDTFTTLSTANPHANKFRSFDSSSSSTTGGQSSGVSAFLKEIPSRKLNMYINPREMPPLPPAATLKRTSLMSSMKTNLDADDL